MPKSKHKRKNRGKNKRRNQRLSLLKVGGGAITDLATYLDCQDRADNLQPNDSPNPDGEDSAVQPEQSSQSAGAD